MSEGWVLELVGYVASALVAISLMMSSILRLRMVNLLGAATFAVYGLLIEAYPVAVVNLFIVFINLYYLRGMLRTEEFFRLLEVQRDSEYLDYFLSFYAKEIRRFFPRFSPSAPESQLTLFVLRDLVPAGLLMGEVRGSSLWVRLDFVIPQFRDFKIGRYLFVEKADLFRARGITEIVSVPGTEEHSAYLRKMGFVPVDAGEGEGSLYRLSLG